MREIDPYIAAKVALVELAPLVVALAEELVVGENVEVGAPFAFVKLAGFVKLVKEFEHLALFVLALPLVQDL